MHSRYLGRPLQPAAERSSPPSITKPSLTTVTALGNPPEKREAA
jgi:hypothetical protein